MGLFGIDSTKQESTTNNQQVALNSGGIGISASNLNGATIYTADGDIAKAGLDVARATSNAAYETIHYVLDSANRFYDRAQNTVDGAVATAENIAARAAPVSPGNYAEETAQQNNKTIITLAVVIGSIFLVTYFAKK